MKSIKMPFQFENGRLMTTNSLDAIARQKIVDVLQTMPFERVMRHNYGANTQQMLFEPIDELTFADFKVDALHTLNESISKVQVLDIQMVSNPVTAYFTNEDTTLTMDVIYKLPLSSPQIVRLDVVVPGAITEDIPI